MVGGGASEKLVPDVCHCWAEGSAFLDRNNLTKLSLLAMSQSCHLSASRRKLCSLVTLRMEMPAPTPPTLSRASLWVSVQSSGASCPERTLLALAWIANGP